MSAKTALTATRREARLIATQGRTAYRIAKAEERLRKAEESLAKAQARLEARKQKLAKAQADARELVAKQSEELGSARKRHAESEAREKAKAASSRPSTHGTLETDTGKVFELSQEAAQAVRDIVGRKRSGSIHADSKAVLALFLALPEAAQDETPETFEVRIRGRKTAILFQIDNSGKRGELRFETVGVASTVGAAA